MVRRKLHTDYPRDYFERFVKLETFVNVSMVSLPFVSKFQTDAQ